MLVSSAYNTSLLKFFFFCFSFFFLFLPFRIRCCKTNKKMRLVFLFFKKSALVTWKERTTNLWFKQKLSVVFFSFHFSIFLFHLKCHDWLLLSDAVLKAALSVLQNINLIKICLFYTAVCTFCMYVSLCTGKKTINLPLTPSCVCVCPYYRYETIIKTILTVNIRAHLRFRSRNALASLTCSTVLIIAIWSDEHTHTHILMSGTFVLVFRVQTNKIQKWID